MSTPARNYHASYDDLPYPTYAQPQTHPDRLATHATLLGMSPAPVERCRVLELGCGDGSNLVPMAFYLPGSEFVGVDRASVPIDKARNMAGELGLSNIRLLQSSIADIPEDLGAFDYVIAHGVYSWVPPHVQEELLAACRRHLAPQGVAYVSYNTLPGNHLRQMVREMMLYHIRGVEEPAEQMKHAIELARFVAGSKVAPDGYGQLFKTELDRFVSGNANHLLHDTLEKHNHSVYFHQFVDQAARHDLQYLAEAFFHEMLDVMLKPEVARTLRQLGTDRVTREQYLDFLKCRFFRQTLLCHKDVTLDLSFKPALARQFFVAGLMQAESEEVDLTQPTPVTFVDKRGIPLRVDWPVAKAALLILEDRYPQALQFEELLDEALGAVPQEPAPPAREEVADALGQMLLQGYASGMLELHVHRPAPVRAPEGHPIISKLTRWELETGRRQLTVLYHATKPVEYEATAKLLVAADGTRNRAALLDSLAESLFAEGGTALPDGSEATSVEQVRNLLDDSFDDLVAKLTQLGLLIT